MLASEILQLKKNGLLLSPIADLLFIARVIHLPID